VDLVVAGFWEEKGAAWFERIPKKRRASSQEKTVWFPARVEGGQGKVVWEKPYIGKGGEYPRPPGVSHLRKKKGFQREQGLNITCLGGNRGYRGSIFFLKVSFFLFLLKKTAG